MKLQINTNGTVAGTVLSWSPGKTSLLLDEGAKQ